MSDVTKVYGKSMINLTASPAQHGKSRMMDPNNEGITWKNTGLSQKENLAKGVEEAEAAGWIVSGKPRILTLTNGEKVLAVNLSMPKEKAMGLMGGNNG